MDVILHLLGLCPDSISHLDLLQPATVPVLVIENDTAEDVALLAAAAEENEGVGRLPEYAGALVPPTSNQLA